jgi:hypothetical protein
MNIPKIVPFKITVAVSGGRDYANIVRIEQILDDLHNQKTIKLLIEGACPHKSHEVGGVDGGADEVCRLWAKSRQVNSVSVPPKSKRIPWPGAGPARNREMAHVVPTVIPDVWILFPGGSGTQSAREIAMEFSITRLEVTDEAYSWIEHRGGPVNSKRA